jgi:hypothetical protein
VWQKKKSIGDNLPLMKGRALYFSSCIFCAKHLSQVEKRAGFKAYYCHQRAGTLILWTSVLA